VLLWIKGGIKKLLMKTTSRKTLLVTGGLSLAAGLLLTRGNRCSPPGACCPSILSMTALAAEAPKAAATNAPAKPELPRLVDLGADKCIPCKIMAPVLQELTKEYEGRMDVEFIDVWKNPEAGKAHKINLIPTQIFYDAGGKELFRHEGFFSKEDILAKWKELGVEFKAEGKKEEKK
jgi:thioredoxin 1